MIAIVNVDTIPRSSGPHIYELRINKEVIATFTHNREDSLEKCLQLASQAAAKAAAPELLEALQYAVAQVPELATVPGISAAITKAVGRDV